MALCESTPRNVRLTVPFVALCLGFSQVSFGVSMLGEPSPQRPAAYRYSHVACIEYRCKLADADADVDVDGCLYWPQATQHSAHVLKATRQSTDNRDRRYTQHTTDYTYEDKINTGVSHRPVIQMLYIVYYIHIHHNNDCGTWQVAYIILNTNTYSRIRQHMRTESHTHHTATSNILSPPRKAALNYMWFGFPPLPLHSFSSQEIDK